MNEGILCLGKGRLSGAYFIDGESVIILQRDGALIKKRLLPNRKIIDDGVVSYSDDCFIFPCGKIEIDSEVRYEADNQ